MLITQSVIESRNWLVVDSSCRRLTTVGERVKVSIRSRTDGTQANGNKEGQIAIIERYQSVSQVDALILARALNR